MVSHPEKPEIAFFDVETTIPNRPGQGYAILEFGAMLVCSQKLIELESYSTLIRPADLSLISSRSISCNGITKDDVVSAPSFAQIADKVYDLLHERIWAGHNILRFDCARIREAFAEINRPSPVPKATIDSLALLTQRFGRRAGDMKMASLATYFGLGQQSHRSLDDVRMNLEVLKYCATVLLFESSLPDIFTENCSVSPDVTKISHNNGRSSERTQLNSNKPSSSARAENHVTPTQFNHINGEIHPLESLARTPGVQDFFQHNNATENAFDMDLLRHEVETDQLPSDDSMEEDELEKDYRTTSRESSSGLINNSEFLEPDKISLPSISVILAPYYRGSQKIHVLHEGVALQIFCKQLRVRFGISTKFVDAAGRARLSFVVDASPSLCEVLDKSDGLARMLSVDSDSSSEWRPLISRKPGFMHSPTIRLHLPTTEDGNMATEIFLEESSAIRGRLLSNHDVTEIDSLLTTRCFVDIYFSMDTYDYRQNAGIRLVAKKLIILSC